MSTKIESINRDLTTKEGWDGFIKERCEKARLISRKKEVEFADVSLVLRRDPMTGEPYPTPILYMAAMRFYSPTGNADEIEEVKEKYVMQMRTVAVAGGAFASLYRSECWLSKNVPINAPHVQPRLDPKRVEAIMLTTAHRDFGEAIYTAEITTKPHPNPKKRPRRIIAPWESGPGMTGRFASFVPPEQTINDESLVKSARVYLQMLRDSGEHELIHRHTPTAQERS